MQPFPSGRVCRRTTVVACVIIPVLILAVCTGSAETAGKGKKGKGKRKGALPTASASPGEGEQSLTNIPLPIGHEAKGLTLPDFDKNGRLRGKFIAGAAKRLDQDHVSFT